MYTFDVTKLDVTFEITNEDYHAIEQRDRDRNDYWQSPAETGSW